MHIDIYMFIHAHTHTHTHAYTPTQTRFLFRPRPSLFTLVFPTLSSTWEIVPAATQLPSSNRQSRMNPRKPFT